MADRQAELRRMLRMLRMPAIAALFEELAFKAAKANLTRPLGIRGLCWR
jgi:hypothetical protein